MLYWKVNFQPYFLLWCMHYTKFNLNLPFFMFKLMGSQENQFKFYWNFTLNITNMIYIKIEKNNSFPVGYCKELYFTFIYTYSKKKSCLYYVQSFSCVVKKSYWMFWSSLSLFCSKKQNKINIFSGPVLQQK